MDFTKQKSLFSIYINSWDKVQTVPIFTQTRHIMDSKRTQIQTLHFWSFHSSTKVFVNVSLSGVKLFVQFQGAMKNVSLLCWPNICDDVALLLLPNFSWEVSHICIVVFIRFISFACLHSKPSKVVMAVKWWQCRMNSVKMRPLEKWCWPLSKVTNSR